MICACDEKPEIELLMIKVTLRLWDFSFRDRNIVLKDQSIIVFFYVFDCVTESKEDDLMTTLD